MYERLRRDGYSVTLDSDAPAAGGPSRYHVRIGNFRSRAKAEAFRKRLRANEGLEARIVRR